MEKVQEIQLTKNKIDLNKSKNYKSSTLPREEGIHIRANEYGRSTSGTKKTVPSAS